MARVFSSDPEWQREHLRGDLLAYLTPLFSSIRTGFLGKWPDVSAEVKMTVRDGEFTPENVAQFVLDHMDDASVHFVTSLDFPGQDPCPAKLKPSYDARSCGVYVIVPIQTKTPSKAFTPSSPHPFHNIEGIYVGYGCSGLSVTSTYMAGIGNRTNQHMTTLLCRVATSLQSGHKLTRRRSQR
jgi:hypothetical protein